MPQTEWGWEITPEELAAWTIHEDRNLLVLNKPGNVLCHPSKRGPWSSVVGACREYLGVGTVHLPSRLDRETSGVVVVGKNPQTGSQLQTAIQHGHVSKTYHAILCGELLDTVRVDQPIGKAAASPVHAQRGIVSSGQSAQTDFVPLAHASGYTLARVQPVTGRMHQIRVHAAWLGHPIAGDKIYGPDPALFLDFLERGWTERHQAMLPIRRHALHASAWSLTFGILALEFAAPAPSDFRTLLQVAGIDWDS
jgi:23S rRNA pseudouridine1911/1915/1917 synthase